MRGHERRKSNGEVVGQRVAELRLQGRRPVATAALAGATGEFEREAAIPGLADVGRAREAEDVAAGNLEALFLRRIAGGRLGVGRRDCGGYRQRCAEERGRDFLGKTHDSTDSHVTRSRF
jgi:hypothetical protein